MLALARALAQLQTLWGVQQAIELAVQGALSKTAPKVPVLITLKVGVDDALEVLRARSGPGVRVSRNAVQRLRRGGVVQLSLLTDSDALKVAQGNVDAMLKGPGGTLSSGPAARTSAGTTAVLSQDVGQVLTIPTAEPESSESEDDSSWSETLLAFFDSLGRPIVGLAVRLVSGETETHATTDAGGRVPSVKGKAQGETIAIHVKKHPARGGGEKEVASYSPRPGK